MKTKTGDPKTRHAGACLLYMSQPSINLQHVWIQRWAAVRERCALLCVMAVYH
jgi:hypothetical protein